MSGGGTSSPVLDFKSLYSLLSDKYKIAVVEKAGYGFSDITDSEPNIDTILQETRKALLKSGVEGPYILFPHSMSGIEALYWAQVYPNEVKAIIGLDMAVPAAYKDYDINMPLVHLSSFAANIGFTRWIPSLSESDAIKYGTLTDEEKELYKVIFYRRSATKNMVNEIKHIKENAEKVGAAGIPNVPILLFSSNGQGTGWNEDAWNEIQKEFIGKHKDGILIKLDSAHYIHDIEIKRIADESEKYIEGLNR
jgi:pimeloyl-ACP methyl ester carboxylesterase